MAKKENLKKSDLKIVFMGTPEFATRILDSLVQNQYNIVGVVTAPDKPSGRGQKINQSDVKKYADNYRLKTLQPINLKDPSFIDELSGLEGDLFVVVAFRMLPESVWSIPKLGTINLHGSLLPQYRGAAPIHWAVINGEKKTGVTTFYIGAEIDTGDIIDSISVDIGPNDTTGDVYIELMKQGAALMLRTVEAINNKKASGRKQSDVNLEALKPAPKIFKKDGEINFKNNVQEVHNHCRGMYPFPGAWCKLTNIKTGEVKTYKLSNTLISVTPSRQKDIVSSNEDGLLFPCTDFMLIVKDIQPEGKRMMSYRDFLAGNSADDLRIH
jgi:methionyl-tRNA formyltransferase